jgi:hypothetical protein
MALTILAFVCLGLLIGNLVGLSAESTLRVILPLLFTFGGGSAVAFLHKLGPGDRKLAGAAVVGLSLSCLLGTYVGIVVSEHQLLTPAIAGKVNRSTVTDKKYLRTVDISDVQLVDQRYKAGEYTSERAYEELYKLLSD